MRVALFLAFALAGAFAPSPAGAALTLGERFTFSHGSIALDRGGRVTSGEALVGAVVMLGASGERPAVEVRFDGYSEGRDFSGAPVPFYAVSARRLDASGFANLCRADAEGRQLAVATLDEHGRPALTCTSGAEGKCILFGYRPWDTKDGISLRDAHRACIRMLRADYGGDEASHTREGTLIAFRDRYGILGFPADNRMELEAVWGPQGAICVARTRIGDLASLDDLARRYPHLVGRLGPDACNEPAMLNNPSAILFNRSALEPSSPR